MVNDNNENDFQMKNITRSRNHQRNFIGAYKIRRVCLFVLILNGTI